MAHEPLRLGILGAARIAPMALIRPAREEAGAEVFAVAARDVRRAGDFAAKHGVPVVRDSYEALLADDDVEAIYNPLPNGLHGIFTERALRAGKHVLCEKPFTANAAEARHVAGVARETGLVCMEAFHWRYHALTKRMLEILASGELGELQRVEARLCAPILNGKDIRYSLPLAGGALMDMGCYALHIVRTLGGSQPTVRDARALLRSPDVDRAMEIDLDFPDGASGRAICSMLSRRVLGVSAKVVGSRGQMAVLNPVLPHVFHRLRVFSDEGARTERLSGPSSYACQLDAFVRAVREGAPIVTGPGEAVKNMELIDAAYQAAGLPLRQPTPQ
jgi:predicted dehydrogenase